MEIIWVRHTSVDVAAGTCYGQTDVPLRSSFVEEARMVYEKLQAYSSFDASFTSPLSRCTRLAASCGYEQAQKDVRLLELNFGAWEMQRFEAISDPRLQEWYADYLHVPATGGESFADQLHRVGHFLDDLASQPYRRVVIFTHGGVIACAQVYAGLVQPEEAFSHVPAYGGVVAMQWPSGQGELR